MNMVTSSNTAKPENRLPKEPAANFLALWIYLQVVQWKHFSLIYFNQRHWGWKEQNGAMKPIKTNLELAPGCLHQVIRNNCKADSCHPCDIRSKTCCKKCYLVSQHAEGVIEKVVKLLWKLKEKCRKMPLMMNKRSSSFWNHLNEMKFFYLWETSSGATNIKNIRRYQRSVLIGDLFWMLKLTKFLKISFLV